jgi:Putative restriction endonuclease
MSVVSIAEAWPAPGKPFTVAELDRMPDDGHRYELLDGMLVVSPRPNNSHQEVAAELLGLLRAACPAGLRALPEPAVQLSRETEFAPDLWSSGRTRSVRPSAPSRHCSSWRFARRVPH